MTTIHPDIIVHWTRPQLTSSRIARQEWNPELPITTEQRHGYVRRLRSIYLRGLRCAVPGQQDMIYGVDQNEYAVPVSPLGMVCFTEVGLDRVVAHGGQYGSMGIGLDRDWLLARGANPVLYIQSARQGIINSNMPLFQQLDSLLASAPMLRRAMLQFLTYIKPMSELGEPTLRHYDDMEWRIVPARMTVPETQTEVLPACFVERRDGIYVPFAPREVQLLVTPDEETRRLILADHTLQECFRIHLPMMIDFTAIGRY